MQTFLTFMLDNERFAVPVANVLEVLQKQEITPVPKTKSHILGIINFRGDIVPVFDTRQKFNLSANSIENARIVIVYEITKNDEKIIISAVADSVKDVIGIRPEEIIPVPESGFDYDRQFISGCIKRNETYILILDINNVFFTN